MILRSFCSNEPCVNLYNAVKDLTLKLYIWEAKLPEANTTWLVSREESSSSRSGKRMLWTRLLINVFTNFSSSSVEKTSAKWGVWDASHNSSSNYSWAATVFCLPYRNGTLNGCRTTHWTNDELIDQSIAQLGTRTTVFILYIRLEHYEVCSIWPLYIERNYKTIKNRSSAISHCILQPNRWINLV